VINELCSLTSGNIKLIIFWYFTHDKNTIS